MIEAIQSEFFSVFPSLAFQKNGIRFTIHSYI